MLVWLVPVVYLLLEHWLVPARAAKQASLRRRPGADQLIQAWAAGELGSLAEVRDVVARSLPPRRFDPREVAAADAAYARFLTLLDRVDTI